jgi:hypothetical protein
MTQIGHHDEAYRSTPLEQKLAWFQNAPGQSAVEPARQFMSGAASLYTDSDAIVRNTMRTLGADWTGDAATNAGSTLQRAADWSANTSASHGAGGETVEGYGESFESLRGKVHWDDPWAWGWNDTASAAASVATLNPTPFLGNLTADYFTTAQQNRTNDATAVAALQAHEEQTRTSVAAFPSIDPASVPPATDPGPNPRAPDPVNIPPTAPATTGGAGGTAGGAAAAFGAGVAGAAVAGAGAAGSRSASGAGSPGIGPGGIPAGAGGIGGQPGAGRPGGTTLGGGPGTDPGGRVGGAAPVGGGLGGVPPIAGRTGVGPLDGRVGGAFPGSATGVPGSDPRLRGGIEAPGGAVGGRDGGPLRLTPGEGAGRFGVGVGGGLTGGGPAGGSAGGWRDVIGRRGSEPGLISRGPAAGPEFAARLPSGASTGGVAAGAAGMPFLGGMGVGAGAQSTEHRNTYWIRSAEPFDVPLPPHGEAVLHGGDA